MDERKAPFVTINPEQCGKDGLCVRVCQKVFSQKTKDSVPEIVHEEFCNSCGHCLLVCPSGAIGLRNCTAEMVHSVQDDLMPSYEQVREMIVSRRSTRVFQDKPVKREVIEKIVDGARFAPTAKNEQSTQFIVVRDKDLLRDLALGTARWLDKVAGRLNNPLWCKLYMMKGATRDKEEVKRWTRQFEDITERMRQGRDLVLHGAPALLLFHADRRISFAGENANLAIQNATFIASSLGLGTFYTGYVVLACKHDERVRNLLPLSKKHLVYGGLALGYPGLRFSRWIERNPAKIMWL